MPDSAAPFEVPEQLNPSLLIKIVGRDGFVINCQGKWLIRADDLWSERWIRFTLSKLNRKDVMSDDVHQSAGAS